MNTNTNLKFHPNTHLKFDDIGVTVKVSICLPRSMFGSLTGRECLDRLKHVFKDVDRFSLNIPPDNTKKRCTIACIGHTVTSKTLIEQTQAKLLSNCMIASRELKMLQLNTEINKIEKQLKLF